MVDIRYLGLNFNHRVNLKKIYIHQAKTNWISSGKSVAR